MNAQTLAAGEQPANTRISNKMKKNISTTRMNIIN